MRGRPRRPAGPSPRAPAQQTVQEKTVVGRSLRAGGQRAHFAKNAGRSLGAGSTRARLVAWNLPDSRRARIFGPLDRRRHSPPVGAISQTSWRARRAEGACLSTRLPESAVVVSSSPGPDRAGRHDLRSGPCSSCLPGLCRRLPRPPPLPRPHPPPDLRRCRRRRRSSSRGS